VLSKEKRKKVTTLLLNCSFFHELLHRIGCLQKANDFLDKGKFGLGKKL